MEPYVFSDEAVNKLATKKTIAIYPMLIALICTSFIIANKVKNNELIQNNETILIFGGIGLFFLIAGFFSAKKGAKGVFTETKFMLDETTIEKKAPNTKDIKMSLRDIKNYRETKRGLELRTFKDKIFIPAELTGYQEVTSHIKKNTQSGSINYSTKFKLNEITEINLAGFGMMALLLSFFILDDKIYKLWFGLPILLLLCYGIVDFFTNKDSEVPAVLIRKVIFYAVLLLGYLGYILIFTN